jgi:Holliday junction resolvase RusA-like endonuclease
MTFRLTIDPPEATHHSKKIVRIGKGPKAFSKLADTPQLVEAKRLIDTALMPFRVTAPMLGPVRLTLDFTFAWRVSEPKRIRARGRIPRDTKPDCSNLAKTTEDRLVAMGFLEDDGQVVELVVRKWFGASPGIDVTLDAVQSAPLFGEEMSA